MAADWETIDVPRGAFIGWGNKKGQHVTGEVMDYDLTGGTDYDGNACPQLEIQLTERAASFTKEGDRTNYDPDELVLVTCGQVSLKRAVKKADPERGDLLKIKLDALTKVANGTVKEFVIQIKRGGGSSKKVDGKPKTKGDDDFDDDDDDDDEPPF